MYIYTYINIYIYIYIYVYIGKEICQSGMELTEWEWASMTSIDSHDNVSSLFRLRLVALLASVIGVASI